MLKLNEKQLEQAYRLALQIGRCEMAKDEEGQAMVRTGLYASTEIPVSRDVVIDAANADIARCHEELKAMGISLVPPERNLPSAQGIARTESFRARFKPIELGSPIPFVFGNAR